MKEDRWEEVKRPVWKGKVKVLPSRSNAGPSGKRGKARLGNAGNVVEVPRARGNGNTSKSRLGNVVEVPRPGPNGNTSKPKQGNAGNVVVVPRPGAKFD